MSKKRAGRWSLADARAVLEQQASSGLSMGAFATREGLDSWRLYRWRKRLKAEKREGRVAAPTMRTKASCKTRTTSKPNAPSKTKTPAVIERRATERRAERVEIVLPSGVIVRVAETIDPSALSRLVTVVR